MPRPDSGDLVESIAELERERELLNAIANTAPSLLCLAARGGGANVPGADRGRRGRGSQIERNLHDDSQQRLVVLLLALRNLTSRPDLDHALSASLDGAIQEAMAALSDLRELSRGIHPAMLDPGLTAALRPAALRAPVKVEFEVGDERWVESPPGAGTRVGARIPVATPAE